MTALNLELINRLKKTPCVEKTWSRNGHVCALLRVGRKMQVKPYESVPECVSQLGTHGSMSDEYCFISFYLLRRLHMSRK